MVYQTRAAHSSAKFRKPLLRNQRYSKEKRSQKPNKPTSIIESCDSGVKSQASEISIKICNADDENVVIQLFRNDTKEQKQDKKKKKGQPQVMRQSAGGTHRHNNRQNSQKHHNTKNHHSDKHNNRKNKCRCHSRENTGALHNLYRRTFGPTIDETLLAGMEALYNTCCVPDCEQYGNKKHPEPPAPPKKQPSLEEHYIKNKAFDESKTDISEYRRDTSEQSRTSDSTKSARASSQSTRRITDERSSYQSLNDPSITSVTTQDKSKHILDFRDGLYIVKKDLNLAKRLNAQTLFMKHDNTYNKSRCYAKADNFARFSDPSAILSDIAEEIMDSDELEEKQSKSSSDPNILHSYSRQTVPLTKSAIKNKIPYCGLYEVENKRDTQSAIGFRSDNDSEECQASSIVLSDTSKTVSNLPKQDSSKFSSKCIEDNLNGDYAIVKMKNKKTAISNGDLPTSMSINKYGIVKTQTSRSNDTSFGFCSEPAAVFRCSVDYTAHGSGGDEKKQSDTKSKPPKILTVSSSSSQTPCQIISTKKVTKPLSKIQEEKSDLKVSDDSFITNVYIPHWERKKTFPTAYFKQAEETGNNTIMPQREKAGGNPERSCNTKCKINEDTNKHDRNYISSIIKCLRDIDAKRQVRLSSCNIVSESQTGNNPPSTAKKKKTSLTRSLSLSSIETSSFTSTKSSFRSDCTECVHNFIETTGRQDKKLPGVVMFPTGQTFMPTLQKKMKLLKQSGDFFQHQIKNDINVFCCKKKKKTDSPYMPAPEPVAKHDVETDVCDCDEPNPLVNEEIQTMAPSYTDTRNKIPIQPPQRDSTTGTVYYDSSEKPSSTRSTKQKTRLSWTNDSEFIELTSKKDNLNRMQDEECQDAVCDVKRRQALRKKKHLISSTSEPDLYSTQSESTEKFDEPMRWKKPNLVNQNTQTLESATSEPSLASLRRRPLEVDSGTRVKEGYGKYGEACCPYDYKSTGTSPTVRQDYYESSNKKRKEQVRREKDEFRSVELLTELPSKDDKSTGPSQGTLLAHGPSVSQAPTVSQGPSVRSYKSYASTEIFDMDGIRWRSIPTETSDEKIYPADLIGDTVAHYPLGRDPIRKKCACKKKELGIQVQPEDSEFVKHEIVEPTKMITYPLSNNTEVQTDPVPLCCLSGSVPEKSHSSRVHTIKKESNEMPVIKEEPANSTRANKGNSRTNTITTAPNTRQTVYSIYSDQIHPGPSMPTVVKPLKNPVDAYKMSAKKLESFVTNTVSLQEVIEKNTTPQETRFAITRVTKYADFTTYEVLKSTKARPKVIPCVTENIFIVKKKDEGNETAPVHEL